MPPLNTRVLHSTQLLWTMAVLSCASLAALLAITVTLATRIAQSAHPIHRVALAASFSAIFALPTTIVIAFLYQRRAKRTTQLVLSGVSATLALTAAVLTMYTLAWIWDSSYVKVGEDGSRLMRALTETGFAVWAVALASQIIFYALVLRPQDNQNASSRVWELDRTSPAQLAKRSTSSQSAHISMSNAVTPVSNQSEPVSSAFSAYSTSPRSSMIFKVIRPVTSRTKLLFHHPFILPNTNNSSGSELSTSVAEQNDGSENCNVPSQKFPRRRLETIPGSRSGSPANALNFGFSIAPSEFATPSSVLPSSESSSLVIIERSVSRSQANMDELGIHPLFRSESPTPPPITSPGTVITASPYAGQVVSPEHRPWSPQRWHSTHMKRPNSSSPLSPTVSRECSLHGHRPPRDERSQDDL